MIVLRNVKGTSRFKKPTWASSWLEYWKDNSNTSDPPCCAACGCKEDLVGAHVQKVSDDDKSWYIVPLCKSCNKQEGSLRSYLNWFRCQVTNRRLLEWRLETSNLKVIKR